MPMIDTTTIRRTPFLCPAWCRLRAVVVKNSVAAACSGDGVLDTSMITSTLFRASARPSPVTTSTPEEREMGTTWWSRSSSTRATCLPTRPVAPTTAILLDFCMMATFLGQFRWLALGGLSTR